MEALLYEFPFFNLFFGLVGKQAAEGVEESVQDDVADEGARSNKGKQVVEKKLDHHNKVAWR
jgi:hypothetical protein